MKPWLASLINAIFLVILGSWGYFASESPSLTALIPVFSGVILGVLAPSVYKRNSTTTHITAILTLLILLALIKPLSGAISRNDTGAIIRVVIMMGSSLFVLLFFIKSFMNKRRKRS